MKTFNQFQEDYARVINPVKPVTDLIGAGLGAVELGKKAISGLSNIFQARKKGKRKLSAAEKKLFDKSQRDTDQRDDMIKSNPTEIDKQNKLIDRYSKRHKTPKQKTDTQKFLKGLARGEIIQDEFSAPTNNVGDGKIAGTSEAGDDPPVKKKNKRGSGMKNRKKKKYAYGGRGSRKMWMA